jgi:hypothetical protein
MNKARYDPELSSGTITAGGTLGILIPPSVMLVGLTKQSSDPASGVLVAREQHHQLGSAQGPTRWPFGTYWGTGKAVGLLSVCGDAAGTF